MVNVPKQLCAKGKAGGDAQDEDDGSRGPPQMLRVSREDNFKNLHIGSVYAVAWDPSGQVLATGSNDKAVKIVRAGTADGGSGDEGSNNHVVTFKGQRCGGHNGTVRTLCFSPLSPDTLLSCGAGDCVGRIWDVARGALRCTLGQGSVGSGASGSSASGGPSTIYSCVVADDGRTALTAGADAVLRLWDIRSGRCERAIQGAEKSPVHCISISPSAATTAATASESGCVAALDLSSGRRIWALHPHAVGAQCRFVANSLNEQRKKEKKRKEGKLTLRAFTKDLSTFPRAGDGCCRLDSTGASQLSMQVCGKGGW